MGTYKRLPRVKEKNNKDEFISFAAHVFIWIRMHWKGALELTGALIVICAIILGARGWWNVRAVNAANKLFEASRLEPNSEAQLKAIEEIAEDYSRTPSGKEAMMLVGDIYTKQKKYPEAIETFRALAGRSRNNGMLFTAALHKMAEAQLASGDSKGAAETYLKAAADPSNVVAASSRFKAGLVLENAGEYEQAKTTYKQIINDAKEDTPEKRKSEDRIIWLVSNGKVSGS